MADLLEQIDMDDGTCSFKGCPNPHESRGYCGSHAKQLRRGIPLHPLRPRSYDGAKCSIGTCGESAVARGWCSRHWQLWRKHGSPTAGQNERRALPRSASLEDRFWLRVNKDGPVSARRPDLGPCWLWTGGRTRKGYGQFHVKKKLHLAHRLAYAWLVGPFLDDWEIDHLCFTSACVNPAHLEPVPGRVNNLRSDSITSRNKRKTHCPKRHPYDKANTYWYRGTRQCRECNRRRAREAYARKRAAITAVAA